MKKLLIISILLLLSLRSYTADIDVGYSAGDIGASFNNYCMVEQQNPANATGTIDHLELYMKTGLTEKIRSVASFYVVSGNNLSTRDTAIEDWVTIPDSLNEFNAPGDFLAFNIDEGDYIGFWTPVGWAGPSAASSGGTGIWYTQSEDIPCTNKTFTNAAGYRISIYAEGTVAGAEAHTQVIIISKNKTDINEL